MLRKYTGWYLVLIVILIAAGAGSTPPLSVQAASLPSAVQLVPVISGLTTPVFITNAGDSRLFIVQQTGQIMIFKNGSLLPAPFLDISGLSGFTGLNAEQGMLGLAFDPNYSSNGNFYITYTTNISDPTFNYTTTLARYHVTGGTADVPTTTATVLLAIPKIDGNHNGGMIAFGPDGYLYMSMGDGGSGGDPHRNGQSLQTMLGKLLRLDVESSPPSGKTYVIPPTNPFYGNSDPQVKQEIWAYGLRNPWRFSFDRSTGDLYIGDVGQDIEEEVDFQPHTSTGGENYGWSVREGNLCYNPSIACGTPAEYVPPVAVYDHGNADSYGCAVTGGYAYEGSQFPALQGVYFYGDYCSGKLLALVQNPDNSWSHKLIASTGLNISSFGEDKDGELYLDDYGGTIYKIAAALVISGNAGDAGVVLRFNDGSPRTVTSGSNGRYSITVPYLWSGTVSPAKSAVRFFPANHSYSSITANQTNQDFTDQRSYRSDPLFDGTILESGEHSSVGGTTDSASVTFNLGDDLLNRQYRSILSFNTVNLPDTAVVTQATIKINQQGLVGTDPFATLGNILVDLRRGPFSGNPALQRGDFQSASSRSVAGTIMNAPLPGNWYQASLINSALPFINKTGVTQLKLRFSIDDNNNLTSDYLTFYSGNYGTPSLRPALVIQYHLP